MKVLLTGGAGFIGSCLLKKLNNESIDDITVVDHLGCSEKWKNLIGKGFQEYMEKGDFMDCLESGKLKKAFDVIIHLGACTSTTELDASYLIENNYVYSLKLAKFALAEKAVFLYASSAATYGAGEQGYSDEDENTLHLKPLNMYGYSKYLFDLWLIKNKLADKVTGFKFFNVFGPNEYHKGDMRSVPAKVFSSLAEGEKMRLFKSYRDDYAHGEQKRDFVYVKDAVDVLFYFIEHPDKKGIFNLGTGLARSWNDLAGALFSALKIKPGIEYIDMPPVLREKYQYFTEADLRKLRSAGCSHEFLTLEEAINDYVEYLKNNDYF
ncbi:MAG: ADP-glyceromanno-heptose 6-epimerase [Candidatus Omnitrophota bacterium]|jgi:ADP-L-glycero-D-manno-heptose 6-epimerase